MERKLPNILEPLMLAAVPCVLLACAWLRVQQAALLTLLVALAALGIMFTGFELSRPRLKDIMPAAVLGSVAAALRILFAPVPDFKPVSAICIIAGITFGKRTGFMVGALAALVSNMFFGQGPWTPWQMYAWGLIGYLAGALANASRFKGKRQNAANTHPLTSQPDERNSRSSSAEDPWKNKGKKILQRPLAPILAFGAASGLLYGFILNSWYIVGFINPITAPAALAAYAAALPFDAMHSVATVAFLAALYLPWRRKLQRIAIKYDLLDG